MADAPKRGRAVPAPERFEVFSSPPTAHLSIAQQQVKRGRAVPVRERFEVLAPLHGIEAASNELARALNEACIARGAGRLTIDDIKTLVTAFATEEV